MIHPTPSYCESSAFQLLLCQGCACAPRFRHPPSVSPPPLLPEWRLRTLVSSPPLCLPTSSSARVAPAHPGFFTPPPSASQPPLLPGVCLRTRVSPSLYLVFPSLLPVHLLSLLPISNRPAKKTSIVVNTTLIRSLPIHPAPIDISHTVVLSVFCLTPPLLPGQCLHTLVSLPLLCLPSPPLTG